ITQREYYQMFDFFNQTEDNDLPDESPLLPLPNKEEREKMNKFKNEITALESKISLDSPVLVSEFAQWEKVNNDSNMWSVVEPVEFKSTNGTTFTKLADHSLLASTNAPDKDAYTVKFASYSSKATALRLEVLPDDSLPSHGP